jgi:hypothetical protein
MTFPSAPRRFLTAPLGELGNTLIEAQSEENMLQSVETSDVDAALISFRNENNHSFDEIMFRETPGQKATFDLGSGKEESPTGVMDLLHEFQNGKGFEKTAILAFVDEDDDGDHVFTDKEDSFVDVDSPLTKPMFLSVSRFEI